MSRTSAAENPWRALFPVFLACAAIGLQAGVAIPLVPLALIAAVVGAIGWGIASLLA